MDKKYLLRWNKLGCFHTDENGRVWIWVKDRSWRLATNEELGGQLIEI